MKNNTKKTKKMLVFSALFAAIISVASFIQVPLPFGVPIALQDMLSMLSGLLLGPLYGTLSVLVFLLLGCLGLPVFTGKAGLQIILASPTGGFLIGYLVSCFIGSIFLKIFLPHSDATEKKSSLLKEYVLITIACILATLVLFTFGVLGFARVTGFEMAKVFKVAIIPFIPGNVIKIVLMVLLTKRFRNTLIY